MPTRIFTPGEQLMVKVATLVEVSQLSRDSNVADDIHPIFGRMIEVRAESPSLNVTFWAPESEVAPVDADHGALRATVAADKEAFGDLVAIRVRGVNYTLVVPRACVTQVNPPAPDPEDTEWEKAELRRLLQKHGLPSLAETGAES